MEKRREKRAVTLGNPRVHGHDSQQPQWVLLDETNSSFRLVCATLEHTVATTAIATAGNNSGSSFSFVSRCLSFVQAALAFASPRAIYPWGSDGRLSTFPSLSIVSCLAQLRDHGPELTGFDVPFSAAHIVSRRSLSLNWRSIGVGSHYRLHAMGQVPVKLSTWTRTMKGETTVFTCTQVRQLFLDEIVWAKGVTWSKLPGWMHFESYNNIGTLPSSLNLA